MSKLIGVSLEQIKMFHDAVCEEIYQKCSNNANAAYQKGVEYARMSFEKDNTILKNEIKNLENKCKELEEKQLSKAERIHMQNTFKTLEIENRVLKEKSIEYQEQCIALTAEINSNKAYFSQCLSKLKQENDFLKNKNANLQLALETNLTKQQDEHPELDREKYDAGWKDGYECGKFDTICQQKKKKNTSNKMKK